MLKHVASRENSTADFLNQGLSHYLEHMLFMGSEQFPDENDYDAYLQSHGGSANAFTELVCFPGSTLLQSTLLSM